MLDDYINRVEGRFPVMAHCQRRTSCPLEEELPGRINCLRDSQSIKDVNI